MYLVLLLALGAPLAYSQSCNSPGQTFIQDKFEEAFKLRDAQAELKDVVKDPANYTLREEIKSYQRQLANARRLDRERILTEITTRFDQMIDKAGRTETIINFPQDGSQSTMQTSGDNSIMLSMKNLSKDNLSFLPPEVLRGIGDKMSVKYYYPIDKFDYEISYKGEDLPMQVAFQKIQDDFEEQCEARSEENYEIRQAKGLDWAKRGYGPRNSGSGGAAGR